MEYAVYGESEDKYGFEKIKSFWTAMDQNSNSFFYCGRVVLWPNSSEEGVQVFSSEVVTRH
jgi:hypothetical protein